MSNSPVVRLGDKSDHDGMMVTASGTITVDNKLVCVDGDLHDCPKRGHGKTPVKATGQAFAGGRRIIVVGDVAECGAIITAGSLTVRS